MHQWLSRVVIVGSADFRCWLHLLCLLVPRDLPRRTVFREAPVLDCPACRVNARPTHENVSALPSRWCSVIHSHVHGHSEKDFSFYPCVAKAREKPNDHEWRKKYLKEHVHDKEEWTLSNSNQKVFCTTFRQSQSCKHVFFLRANRQYHLNTITNSTHTS